MLNRVWILGPALAGSLLLAACGGDKKDATEATPAGSAGDSTVAPTDAAGGGTATGTGGTPAPQATVPPQPTREQVLDTGVTAKPCTMLTEDEVKAAVGAGLIDAEFVADDVQPLCKWSFDPSAQDDPKILDVVITAIGNTNLFNAASAGASPVSGVGDEAYAIPASSSVPAYTLWVRQGNKTLRVQFGPLTPLTDDAKRSAFNQRAQGLAGDLATKALARL